MDEDETGALLEVVQEGSQRWAWRYVNRRHGLVLAGNESFATEAAATASAAAAYPDIEQFVVQRLPARPNPKGGEIDRRAELVRLVAGLGAAAAATWALRAYSRTHPSG
jgi:hypothetical protein